MSTNLQLSTSQRFDSLLKLVNQSVRIIYKYGLTVRISTEFNLSLRFRNTHQKCFELLVPFYLAIFYLTMHFECCVSGVYSIGNDNLQLAIWDTSF